MGPPHTRAVTDNPTTRITLLSLAAMTVLGGLLALTHWLSPLTPRIDPTILTAILLAHPLGLLGVNRLANGERVTGTLIQAPMVLTAIAAGPKAAIALGIPLLILGEVSRRDTEVRWRIARTAANLVSGLIALCMIALSALLAAGLPVLGAAAMVCIAAAVAVPAHGAWMAWITAIATGSRGRIGSAFDGLTFVGTAAVMAACAGLGMLLIGEPAGAAMLIPFVSWIMGQHQNGAITQELHEATTVLDLLVETTTEATAADARDHITELAAEILNCQSVELVHSAPETDAPDSLAVEVEGLGWLVARGRLHATPFNSSHQKMLVRIAAVSRAAIQAARSRDALRRTAHTDPLTGLPNRIGLHQAVQDEKVDAVLLIDLDRFKAVNDTYGHAAGDAVLKATADRLMSTIRRGDVAARLGGDEFVVVLANLRQHEEAALVAERIEVMLMAPVDFEGQVLQVGASVGVQLVGDDQPLNDALRLADEQMYAVKARHHGDRTVS